MRSSGLTVLGVLATVAWFALWAFAIWGDYTAATLVKRSTALTLNEWSALAAAIFAPIGVLWLVIGQFRQAAAIARNTAALLAQEHALKVQAEETAALTREHARHTAVAASLAEMEAAAHRRHEDARRIGRSAGLVGAAAGSRSGAVPSAHAETRGPPR